MQKEKETKKNQPTKLRPEQRIEHTFGCRKIVATVRNKRNAVHIVDVHIVRRFETVSVGPVELRKETHAFACNCLEAAGAAKSVSIV